MTVRGSLDANVVLRLLLQDLPRQHRAAMALIADGDFVIDDAALIETVFVLSRNYQMQRDAIATTLGRFLDDGGFRVDQQLFSAALNRYVHHPKLSFEDCYLVARAERDAAEPLWTFDRKLANQTSAELVPDAVT